MLSNLTDDGTMTWTCHGCNTTQTAHVSHADVQYTSPTCVSLPLCTTCLKNGVSSRSMTVVGYRPEDLKPPILAYHPDGSIADCAANNLTLIREHVEMRPHPETGEPVRTRVIDEVIHPAPSVQHNMNLVAHLQAHGKVYTPPDPAAGEQVQREQHKALILEVLKEQGIVPSL